MKTKIDSFILNHERFKTLRLNTRTNKIELEGDELLNSDYEEIYEEVVENFKDEINKSGIKKSLVKERVKVYAKNNSYSPTPKNLQKSSWYSKLDFDKNEEPKKTLHNVVNFFTYYPKYLNKFAFNEFTREETLNDITIRDFDISYLRHDCEQNIGINTKDYVETAVQILTHNNSFNPFKTELEKIIWDGVERAESLFIDAIGVEDTKLNRSFTKKWLYALIKRLYEPGCMFDHMLIVCDENQGTGKTKLVQRLVSCLGVGNYGYCDTVKCDSTDSDNVDKMNKSWIVAFDEMAQFMRKESDELKTFISANSDLARMKYGRRSVLYDRHCVFYGSTNDPYFLKDYTSDNERRYWIMNANGTKHDSVWWQENFPDEYLKQVLAEMKYLYDVNKNFNYNDLSLEESDLLTEMQYEHKTLQNDDVLLEKILYILNKDTYVKEFDNYNAFINWTRDSNEVTIKELFENPDSNLSGPVKINRIPVKYLKGYIEDELKRHISTKYLTALLKKYWVKNYVNYNHEQVYCYVRE